MAEKKTAPPVLQHPLFIVSGGYGISGEQIARTAIAQFTNVDIEVVVIPHVHSIEQVKEAVKRASNGQATILHTLVNADLRATLVHIAREENVTTIDLIGVLLGRLANVLGMEPMGQPGLYHQLREDYFKRIEAIEFSVQHDDGKRPGELGEAEIVLVGPSRVGKTPLSMYLSVQGWKVANIPLALKISPPKELFQVDPRRVIGLNLDPGQLIFHRKKRQKRLGLSSKSDYSNPGLIMEEVQGARQLYRQGGFPVVDATDRPIEETAEEIIGLIKRRTR